MTQISLEEKIRSYILPLNLLEPTHKKDFEHYIKTSSFSLVVRKNQIHVKPNFTPFQTKDIKKCPAYVQFNFESPESFDLIKGDIIKISHLIPTKPMLKAEMAKIKDQVILLIDKISSFIPLKNITFHYLDGEQCGDNTMEAHIASHILELFINGFIWPMYIASIAGLEEYFEKVYEKEKLAFLSILNEDDVRSSRVHFETHKKTGANFFGTDTDLMDYSITNHKDIYQDVVAKAKERMHYYEYPDRDVSFKFWITHM
ncbi:MAG: hypothetical protein KBD31_02845 [Proteobacteria bacterium]|nr:hypothetical protein [Pseudomonadota bacterium]